MPTPLTPTFSTQAKTATNAALRDTLDSGAGAALLRLRNAADQLLAQGSFTNPCGTLSGHVLTLTLAANPMGVLDGQIAFAELCDSTGLAHVALPAKIGEASESGWLVLPTLTAFNENPVEIFEIKVS